MVKLPMVPMVESRTGSMISIGFFIGSQLVSVFGG